MILLPVFDPTANGGSGTFNLNLTGGRGKAVIYNESNSNLKLQFSNNYSSYVPAWTAVMYCFTSMALTNPEVSYSTVSTLQGIVATTISQVAVEIYEANEPVGGTFPAALVRQLSVGNQVSSNTSTNQVNNDGNPAVTTFVEATQSGNTSGSNVAIGNDGSFIFAQFVSSVFTQLLKLAPGANPTLLMGKGLTIQSVDAAGANASNIFGVDSGSRTFLQAQTTGNQIAFYDKNGSNILTADGANKTLSLTGVTQSVNGDTSGTASVIEGLIGPYKLTIYEQNNYRQAGSANTLTLKNSFSFGAILINAGCGGVSVKNGGSTQNIQVVTALASGGGTSTPVSAIQTASFGWLVTAFNQFADSGAMGSARTGLTLAIGI